MAWTIYLAGLLAISGIGTYFQLRADRKKAEAELLAFAATVPAPLTEPVRHWLRPQLQRRSEYIALGTGVGLVVAHIPLLPNWFELPWYWFAALLGSGAGFTVGTLVAGYRTVPLLDGSLRTVDPARRRVRDHFGRSRVLRLRLSVMVAGAGLLLAGAVAISSDAESARRALLGCGLAALLVAAHYGVAVVVIARPLVTSTPEGLLWQKALLTRTMEPVPTNAFRVALFSAVIALFSAVVAYRDLPLPVQVFGACFAVLTIASVTAVLMSDKGSQQAPLHVSSEPSTS